MIDWSELEPYENDQRRSFEELCYQIAKGFCGEKGRFTSVDDSGGGDGVEFYLTFPNGDQWGWQAKFYHPEPRLSKSGRKRSIINSLKRSCEIHPNLKRWILCTPTNFTPKEQEWFNDTLPQSIPDEMCVELEHWQKSDFNTWLSEKRFRGKLHYFFGKLELDLDWFKRQFEKQMAGVGDKFDSSLHTETDVDTEIHALLGDKAFVPQITKWIEELEENLPYLREAIDDLKRPIENKIEWDEEEKSNEIEWDEKEKSKVIRASESLQDALVNIIDKCEQARKLLNKQELTAAQAIERRAAFDQLRKVFDNYEKATMESGISQIKYIGEKEDEEQVLRKASSVVHGPRNLVARLLDKFFRSVIWQCGLINKSDLHILGDAGIGKTHIACDICDDRLKNGLPALFVRGNLFTTDQPIGAQLQDILDIPRAYNWHDFLQALSAAAEAYHTRIPLIIDGLNESVHNGTFSNIWELGLKGLIQEITQTKNIVLITTCRRSYKETIWKDATPKEFNWKKLTWEDNDSPNWVYAYGFDRYEEVEPAVEKYFNAYKIKADLTGAPLAQFEHPIYLKIFCETKNRERKTEVQAYVGEQTLFEVFDEYLEQCNEAVCTRLGIRQGTPIVQPILNEIAKHLWQNCSRNIPVEELVKLTDNQLLSDLNWPLSKARAIEAESLLVCRDRRERKDAISFTYDLLGGYLIAKYLVEQAAGNVQTFLNGEDVATLLFGENHHILHPLQEDICRCLAALLPAKTGHFLHELSENKKAFGLSVRALFEISPENITEDCKRLVAYLFNEYKESRDWFLELAETTVGHPDHPFCAPFWSKQLSALSMPKRDLSWTEHVRKNREKFEKKVIHFEETCRSAQDLSKERLHLLAEYIMWILASTVRPLRDEATRALYWYGRRFPQEFFELAMKSFTINDPYISERMLAATYGIAMARQNDFEDTSFVTEILPEYAKQLYEKMFKSDAPHSTTHILTRDYARRTIDIALIHHPNLLTADERKRVTPPFTDGEIQDWGESEDRNEGEYEKGPAPLQMDFENYTLGSLVKDRGNYNYEHPEYKRVRANILWRIYDLEYSSDDFGEIDALLNQQNQVYGRSANGGKTDRYGKKYSWIAFYELAGFRQDNDLLPDYDTNLRILDTDIDPSFPDEQYKHDLVREDFLGDRNISHKEWVFKSNHPDLTNYLKVDRFCDDLKRDRLCGEDGPWVLLWGSLSQEDKKDNRDIFTLIQGLIVKPEETEAIVETFTNQEAGDRSNMPFCPEDYYTYAGEVPWCDTYPENSCEDIQIEIGKVLVPEQRVKLLRNDKPIPSEEIYELRNSITDLLEKEDEETLKAWLRKRNLDIAIEIGEVEETEYKTFEVLVPVRENNWEDHRSAINSNRSVAIPSRQIAEALGLCGQPQSFDLFQKESGKRASITFRYGEGWGEMQRFTYLRQDLLERYLAETGSELIWIIWGERRQVSQNPDASYKYFHEVKVYRDI